MRFRAIFVVFVFGLFLGELASRAQTNTNTAPVIVTQPANGIAGLGEDFVFNVSASAPGPLTYQWYADGSLVSGATNASLLLTNLTIGNGGSYVVNVSNSAGAITTSSNAVLTIVLTNTAHRLQTGRVIQVGGSVAVPIILRANGRENAFSFSLSYNTAAYTNPRFLSTNGFTLDLSQTGMVGVAMTLAPGATV